VSRLLRHLRRWPIIAGIIVVVLAGGGVTAWAMTRSSSGSGSTQLVAAAVNTVTSTVSASGTVEPAHEASLDFGASGRVRKVYVKTGDTVHKGQRLAAVSTSALRASKDAASASLTAAEDTVAEDGGSTSSAQAAADKAALSAAKSSLRSAKTALRDAVLRSTIAGTVTSVDLTVGQQVTGGSDSTGSDATSSASDSSSTTASGQVDVQSSTSFVVDASVDDTEISNVKVNQAVSITTAGATSAVSGTVSSVSSVPTSSSGVVSFPVVVEVAGHPSGVYAGSSATLIITTKKSFTALEIPTLAIRYSGSQASVSVDSGGHTVTRTITVGQSLGLETQVLTGITAGEKVVVTVPTFGRGATNRGGTGGGGFGGGGFGNGGGFGGDGFGSGGFGGGGFGGSGSGGSGSGGSGG
jgi:multidrug efflux pump subunit AcrA (membrane-fusion protein)